MGPKLPLGVPPKTRSRHYLKALRSRERPRSDAGLEVEVVRALTAIRESID